MRKPDFCICENKDADQLRGNREADLRLCFRICKKPIFSRRGSFGSKVYIKEKENRRLREIYNHTKEVRKVPH